jgi:hypothetical protein
MNDYLEEAAALLRKAADQNEQMNRLTPSRLNQGRERLAKEFAKLAAIEKGLVPREIADEFLTSTRDPENGWPR